MLAKVTCVRFFIYAGEHELDTIMAQKKTPLWRLSLLPYSVCIRYKLLRSVNVTLALGAAKFKSLESRRSGAGSARSNGAAANSLLGGNLAVEIDQDVARLGAFVRADHTAVFEQIHDPSGPGVADAQPAL
jgi:hypothetical protein